MVSTDGSRDDEEREDGSLDETAAEESTVDESVLPPGPRRSTYTPPANPSAGVPGMQPPAPVSDPSVAPVVDPPSVSTPPKSFDFDFGKPPTAPVNVVYQLDDIEPELPFGVPVESLAPPPAGARILPKEPAPSTPPAPVGGTIPVDLPPPLGSIPGVPSFIDAPPPVFSLDVEPEVAPEPVVEPEPEPEAEPEAVAEPEPHPVEQPEPVEVEVVEEPEPEATVEPEPEPDAEATDESAAESAAEPAQPDAWEPAAWEPTVWEPESSAESEPALVESEPFAPAVTTQDPAYDEQPSFDEPAYVEPSYIDPPFEEPVYVEPTYDDAYDEDAAASDPAELPEVPEAPAVEPVDTTAAPEFPASPEPPLTEAEQLARLSQQGAPSGRPWVPERKSLRDDELSSLLADAADQPGGTLGVMEQLEHQVQLREEEAREFQDWQQSMLAVGTPEAIAAVEKVLPQFTDIVSPATAAAVAAAVAAAPPVVADPAAATGFVAPPPAGVPSATPPPPGFESRIDAPAPAFGSQVTAPPPAGAPSSDSPPPVTAEPAYEEVVFEEPANDEPAYDEPAYAEPAYEKPAYEEPAYAEPVYPQPLDSEPAGSEPAFSEQPSDQSGEVPSSEVHTGEIVSEPASELEGFEVDGDQYEDLVFEQTVGEGASSFAPPAEDAQQVTGPPVPPPLVEPPAFPEPWAIAPENPAAAVPLTDPENFGGLFVDPIYAGPATGSVSVLSGSLAISPEDLDTEIDDAVDEVDQVGFDDLVGPVSASPATAPVFVTRIPDDEVVLGDQELERPRVFSLEVAGLEPTPEEQRVGRAARMFWLWFAANASISSVAFGGILFSLGLSLRQAVVGILAGVAVSFLPLGLGTLAGKLSGQPTMVVSRAAFGVRGNVVPAVLALVSRIFWGAALLWILGQGVASILIGAGIGATLGHSLIATLSMAGGFVIAGVIALFGYGLIAKFQLVVSILSGVLIIGLIALTWEYVDVATALTHPDGSWMLAGTAAVLVFSFVGLLWANSSADLARYQRPGTAGASSMLWTTIGATIPTFLLISYGALLAASSERIATGLLEDPFHTLGDLLPIWYPAPLIAAVALGLISGVVVTIYSGGFALKAIGVNTSRALAVVVVGVLVVAGAFALILVGTGYTMLFRDLATTLAVPIAAWAGIFAADTMIRNRALDAESLLKAGGVYASVNWVNLVMLFVISALGFGLTTATASWLGWQGYLFPLLGVSVDSALAGTDLGVFVALLLGLLVPIVSGVPGIRKQEATARRSG